MNTALSYLQLRTCTVVSRDIPSASLAWIPFLPFHASFLHGDPALPYHLIEMSSLKLSLIPQKCTRLTPTMHCKFLLFSLAVESDSLRPHGLQHAKLLCPSPSLRVAQTQVHSVSGAIQPSHPLSSPSPSACNLSQHQGLFQWVGSSCQVAKVLELQLQHQSFQ